MSQEDVSLYVSVAINVILFTTVIVMFLTRSTRGQQSRDQNRHHAGAAKPAAASKTAKLAKPAAPKSGAPAPSARTRKRASDQGEFSAMLAPKVKGDAAAAETKEAKSGEPTRAVHCREAVGWLKEQKELPGSVIVSMPDISEMRPRMELERWKAWFTEAARLILERTPPDAVAIFYQSDIKVAGTWVDKAFLVQQAAARVDGVHLLWHKIVVAHKLDSMLNNRASYSHMLCFSKNIRVSAARPQADILPARGKMTWVRAMGLNACQVACEWIQRNTAPLSGGRRLCVVDPFCGRGSALAVANALGMDAVGVEMSDQRCGYARRLQLSAAELAADLAKARKQSQQLQQAGTAGADAGAAADSEKKQSSKGDAKADDGTTVAGALFADVADDAEEEAAAAAVEDLEELGD